MDGVIPVEVASFRLGERLVSGVQCGSTGGTRVPSWRFAARRNHR